MRLQIFRFIFLTIKTIVNAKKIADSQAPAWESINENPKLNALAYYGVPRYTGDIDLFVKPEAQNASYILKALDDFGFGSARLKNQFYCYWINQKIKYMKRTKNAK